MKINAQPNWLNTLSRESLNSLSMITDRVTVGNSEVLMTPFMAHRPDDTLRNVVESILSNCDLTPKLRQIEDDNLSKFGPRSIAKPWADRWESLADYFHSDEPPRIGRNFNELIEGSEFLRPTSIVTAAGKLISSSNSGLPYLKRKGMVESDAVSQVYKQLGEYPCVLFTRTAEQGKTRNVWGYPISDTLMENTVLFPYLEKEKQFQWRAALLGPDRTDDAMTLMLASKPKDSMVVCVDFSNYDASVSWDLIQRAFASIAGHFQRAEHPVFEALARRFASIPIWTPDGEWSGTHGVPSGSSFTNTVDSEVQRLASGMCNSLHQIQGDDGVYIIPKEKVSGLYANFEKAGLRINQEKSEEFEDDQAVYLQRYYHQNYRSKSGGLGGVYSVARAVNRIKYLESWTNLDKLGLEGSDFFALRAIMILENCKHHPGFVELVHYVEGWDRNGLDFSSEGLKAYSSALQSKARAGIFNQSDLREGLNDFETVKLLRS